MRKHQRRKTSSVLNQIDNLSTQRSNQSSARLPSVYSPPNLNNKEKVGRVTSSIELEVHLTVRPLVELSRRKVSLLLENYLYRVTLEGIDLEGYLYIEWMNNYLRGNRDPYELKEEKERLVIRLSDLLLRSCRENWTTLGERSPVDKEVTYWIHNLLDPTGRKFSSRKIYYQLEKFLEFRTVPVSSVFEREGNSIRYSSYCKGYGESRRMGRRQKTRPSFELDGKETSKPGEVSLEFISIYFSLNLLEEKLKMKRA